MKKFRIKRLSDNKFLSKEISEAKDVDFVIGKLKAFPFDEGKCNSTLWQLKIYCSTDQFKVEEVEDLEKTASELFK